MLVIPYQGRYLLYYKELVPTFSAFAKYKDINRLMFSVSVQRWNLVNIGNMIVPKWLPHSEQIKKEYDTLALLHICEASIYILQQTSIS